MTNPLENTANPSDSITCQDWTHQFRTLLEDKKAQNISSFEVNSAFAGHFIIVSALSTRHLWSLCYSLERVCKDHKIPFRCQGKSEETSWIIFEAQDTLIHLFLKEGREYYDLERLWGHTTSTDHENE
jgi:ribosome-associated protein